LAVLVKGSRVRIFLSRSLARRRRLQVAGGDALRGGKFWIVAGCHLRMSEASRADGIPEPRLLSVQTFLKVELI
jgi:hypothetical protein